MVELRIVGRVRVYFLYASLVFSLLAERNGVLSHILFKKKGDRKLVGLPRETRDAHSSGLVIDGCL
jgi:hypothetical protein